MASKISINLDTSKENFLVNKCKQNDDLTLEAYIYENGAELNLTNKEIIIQALKADNTYIIQNTEIVKENNKILAELDRDFSRVSGTTKIEILLVESGKQNTTFSFYLEVSASVIKGAVESSNTVTVLEALENKIVEAGAVKEETEQLIQNGGAATTGQIAEINAQLEDMEQQKASKDDVAKISSGTPLFAPNVASMSDITKNYVNTTDGFLYIYSGSAWVKTNVQYQSTGIADNSIEYKQVNSKSAFSNINNENLFENPTLENNLNGWSIVNNDGHVATEKTLADSFSKGAYVPMTVTGNSLIQRIPLSKLATGEYKVRCRKKTSGTNYNGRLIIQLSNSVGTTLFEVYRSGGITTSIMEHTFTFNKEMLLATYPTAVYLTISFGHGSPTADCTFYEPFIGLTSKNTNYNNFKFEEIMNNITNPISSLANKIGSFIGDSICQGVANGGGYAKILADTENLIVENKGIGGGTIAKNTYYTNGTTPRFWICDNVSTMRVDADYAIFEGGRNDYGVNVPLGVLTTDYTGVIDDTTFYGALEYMFRQALLRFKEKKIGFIVIHKANAEPYTKNAQGFTMEDYYNAIIKTCKKYSIPVCNLYEESGLITALSDLKTTYTDNADGLHPNDLGYKKYYVPKISAWMKTL